MLPLFHAAGASCSGLSVSCGSGVEVSFERDMHTYITLHPFTSPIHSAWTAGHPHAVPASVCLQPHFDSTILPQRTGIEVAVLYLALPPPGARGGALHVYRASADVATGSPVCVVEPVLGALFRFRGDLCHGVTPMRCPPGDGGGHAERMSIVLEQYSMKRMPALVPVWVDRKTVLDLRFGEVDSAEERRAAAVEFVRRHRLQHGPGCDGASCVVERLVEQMDL